MIPSSSSMPVATDFGIDHVVLVVNDLDQVSDYYQKHVGLQLLERDGGVARLGAGSSVLLELRRDNAARRHFPQEAGLFHTAFLLPHRAALGQWIHHAVEKRIPIAGASDHSVSEAIYLTDPEGNGVEIYADRPRKMWKWRDGKVFMNTMPLDVQDLLASAGQDVWKAAPPGTRVGHVHLQVGDLAPAEAFYHGQFGLGVTCHYPGGTFYALDGYHHHFATNTWNSRGAPRRALPSTGLAEVVAMAAPGFVQALRARKAEGGHPDGPVRFSDPWGTVITVQERGEDTYAG